MIPLIQANCRAQITPEDLQFVVETLDPPAEQRTPLNALVGDADTLDRLLDDPALFNRLLAAPRLLEVSPYFFYYVVVRRSFVEHGIDERRVADYVGALLSHHLWPADLEDGQRRSLYLVDAISAIDDARNADEAFERQTEVGDRALFLAGIFPDWIYHRATYGRRAVSLSYFESMGRSYYGAAARTGAARARQLEETLEFMARRFTLIRQALNHLSDEHLHLGAREETVDRLCRRVLYRTRN